jgi:hypothetical protein
MLLARHVYYMLLGSAVKFSHNDNPSGRHVKCCWEGSHIMIPHLEGMLHAAGKCCEVLT